MQSYSQASNALGNALDLPAGSDDAQLPALHLPSRSPTTSEWARGSGQEIFVGMLSSHPLGYAVRPSTPLVYGP